VIKYFDLPLKRKTYLNITDKPQFFSPNTVLVNFNTR